MAIDVRFDNIGVDFSAITEKYAEQLRNIPTPAFESHKEDITTLRESLRNYEQYQNILIIGNGGSIWSFMPFYTALANRVNGKNVVLLTDMEPDYLNVVKAKYTPTDSLVIVISKSGSTVGTIENLFAFAEYPQLYVTDKESTLGKIGAAREIDIIVHPPVGGRYSSFTSCAYVPAILSGLDVEALEAGGRQGYDTYRKIDADNPALRVALALYELENQDYTEIFLPIYSNFLQTFGMIVTQLFHESFGKDGKGLSVVAAQAPESQHHTNQRFFGGRKNMVGCFLHVKKQHDESMQIVVPEELTSLTLRNGSLADINGIRLANSFEAEYLGTYTDAKNQHIPLIDVCLSEVKTESVGELMAFWHYVTVFSAALRQVDPFDQPQVENSKVISFMQRQQTK
jgi:glucose-6-phosphate isomerase